MARRFQNREANLLARIRTALHPKLGPLPYRKLFEWSGCEYGDVAALVKHEGAETALRSLLQAGIYLNVEELKGRAPVMRGSESLWIEPHMILNPRAQPMVFGRTSASRGAGTPVSFDLGFVRDYAVDARAYLDARGGDQWRKAIWASPGAAAQFGIIAMSSFGEPAERWFTQVKHDDAGLHPRYRWSSRAIVLTSRAAGRPIPTPTYVPLSDPEPIAQWLAATLRRGATPLLQCFSSSAVLICQAAMTKGIDISGSQLMPTGEPFTPSRRAATDAAGVTAVTRFAAVDVGHIAYGCLNPAASDDTHLITDMLAAVQPERDTRGPAPLYLTSLSPRSTSSLVNVSIGDAAVISERQCGCPLERLGWVTHLHTIRSSEKLTANGTTLLDVDIIRILEHDLPNAFGGSVVDYQLIEEEVPDGRAAVRLLVSPNVGPQDDLEIERVFRSAIAAAGGAEHIMMRIWESGQTLRIERREPYMTSSGKVHHVHRLAAVGR